MSLAADARPVIAFDLDGTLVDSTADLATALNGALRDVGLAPHSLEAVRSFIGEGARRLIERSLERDARPTLADDVLLRFRIRYEHVMLEETRPFPGIEAALRDLHVHADLAVCTNKPGTFARPLVKALLPDVFFAVLGPDDVDGRAKPDPAMIHALALRAGRPVRALVGDSAIDVATARNAGIRAIGVSWGLAQNDALADADAIASSPADFLPSILSD